ncbi:MAG TPA: hypothetical protein VGQ82_12220 [Chthoniobacterales bacterium]|nr:hypothetical protein [Chthoniobacterales bacterium]
MRLFAQRWAERSRRPRMPQMAKRRLGATSLDFYHTDLMTDSSGRRLAKREAAFGPRALRVAGVDSETLREKFPVGQATAQEHA